MSHLDANVLFAISTSHGGLDDFVMGDGHVQMSDRE